MSIHPPLNGKIQKLELDKLGNQSISKQFNFENRWNFYYKTISASTFSVSVPLLEHLNLR